MNSFQQELINAIAKKTGRTIEAFTITSFTEAEVICSYRSQGKLYRFRVLKQGDRVEMQEYGPIEE